MIIVQNVSKDYILFDNFGNLIKFLYGSKHITKSFRALDNITFSVSKGEVLGIIGDNGAGKSTLLKILSGVISPSEGQVIVKGKSSAILETSTGFHPELTGRENIYRRLLLNGYSKKEIRKIEPEIIEFSELSDFIDEPVRTYSSGMAAKLAFSILTAAPSEIMFIDEILAVGDEHFQGKSIKRIKDICKSGRTVVIVSHNTNYIERLCDRVIWLEKGKIKMEGPTHNVLMNYYGCAADKIDKIYPREIAEIKSAQVFVLNGFLEIHVIIERFKLTDDSLHLQIAVHDNQHGILCALLNTSYNEGNSLPSMVGLIKCIARIHLPSGLRKGLLGLVLFRGSGSITESKVEDAWGWDNGKQIYFNIENSILEDAYLGLSLKWERCL